MSSEEEMRDRREMASKRWNTQSNGEGSLTRDMLKGAIGGAIGVIALDKVTWEMWDREDPEAIQREREARPEELDPAHAIANRAAEALRTELMPNQPHTAGIVVHYSLGVVPGAVYGALRKRAPIVTMGAGTAFGLALFLLQDEGLNPVIGTSDSPGKYPWQAHVRGAVGHAVLGAVMEGVLDVFDRVYNPTS